MSAYCIFWRLLQRARGALFVERFLGGYSFPPNEVEVLVTARCNLRCPYCLLLETMDAQRGIGDLDRALISRLLDQVAWFRPSIVITGGEPLLRNDILEIAAEVKARDLLLTINTNGTIWSDDLLEGLIERKVDSVTVSLDAWGDEHDAIRNSPGAFSSATRLIERLDALKRGRASRLPLVRVNTVVSHRNLRDIVEFYEKFRGQLHRYIDYHQFVLMSFVPAEAAQEDASSPSRPTRLLATVLDEDVSFEHAGNLAELLAAIRHDSKTSVTPDVRTGNGYFSSAPMPDARCTALYFQCGVYSDGEVGLCATGGNLATRSFAQCWNSPALRDLRRLVLGGKMLPGCFRCCMQSFSEPDA